MWKTEPDMTNKISKYSALFCIYYLLICSAVICPAQETDSLETDYENNGNGVTIFYEANSRYRDGIYNEAITLYEELLKEGLETGALYYNLGNAYFKTGQKGKAILNYLRAQRLMPRDPDLRSNLSYACSLIEGGQIAAGDNWFVFRWKMLCDYITINETVCLMSVFYIAAMIMIFLFIINRKTRLFISYFIVLSSCFSVLFLAIFAAQIHKLKIQTPAVVLSKEAPVRFEPSEDATDYYQLYEGHTVRVIKPGGQWCQIKRPDGKSGWVRAIDMENL